MGIELYPTSEPQYVGPAEDVEAVREVHRDWWAANGLMDVPRAERNFAPQTVFFNLNGHTYYGTDELVTMWTGYVGSIRTDTVPLWDYRIFVSGDLAYVTCEGVFATAAISDEGWRASNVTIGEQGGETVPIHFRETSVFRRDDGDGNPVWRMWHFHCSAAAPDNEPRPGFGDTFESRGGDRGGSVLQTAELPEPVA